jgi:protein involved in polysaccharide export with SLBB domain
MTRPTGKFRPRCVLQWLLPALLPACSSTPTLSEIAKEINSTRDETPITIERGDSIQISTAFAEQTTWNQLVRVREDGRASFLRIGELVVTGLSVKELQQLLADKYGAISGAPKDLTVNVFPGAEARRSHDVYVTGEVHDPGAIALDGRTMTLIEAVARAGGELKYSADLSSLLLVRRMPHGGKIVSWVVDAHPDYWGEAPAIYLQPNDVIFVPNTTIDDINIWVDKYIRQMIPLPSWGAVAPY